MGRLKIVQRIAATLLLALATSCYLPGNASYIGYYEISCKKSDDTPRKVRNIAEQIVSDLGLKFDDVIDDGLALDLIVRQSYGNPDQVRPGLVFSYVRVPGDFWNITIAMDGVKEDRQIQFVREHIEKVLRAQTGSEWSYRVAHHSLSKP